MEPRIAGFEILEPIGSGAMSSVWRARSLELGREVALKVLHPHVAVAPGLRDRFLHEARAYERLSHANVVTCLAEGHEGEAWFVALEHLAGGDLRALLRAAGKLPPETAAFVLGQVLAGLAHAHGAGVVHRDLKPENVMLGSDGAVKLADFGISIAPDFTRLTEAGTLVGTPAYMAPEQVRNGDASPRSDLWSAGVLLHEMITGRNPFDAGHASATVQRLATLSPAPMGYRVAGVPEELDALAAALLAHDPGGRPPSAEAALERLRPVLAAAGDLAGSGAIAGLLSEPASWLGGAARRRARPRLERARALLGSRPPRPGAAWFEAAEALEIDSGWDEARALAAEAGARAGTGPQGRVLSPRLRELEQQAEASSTGVAPLLNLVRQARAEGELQLAARAYRWARARSGDDRFAFAQLASALGLELAAHLEGLHPEALAARLQGRGALQPGAAPGRPLIASPPIWIALGALAVTIAWSVLSPRPVAAPQPRPPRRAARPTPAPVDPIDVVLERAEAVADDGDAERAIAIYAMFLEERPRDRRAPEVKFRIGRALEELGRGPEAITVYREVAELWPTSDASWPATRRRARLLEEGRDFDAALAALEALGEGRDSEEHASLTLQRARLHERQGELERALELYRQIEGDATPSYVRVRARLGHGRVLALRGDPEARRWLGEAMSEAGASSDVGREALEIEARLAAGSDASGGD